MHRMLYSQQSDILYESIYYKRTVVLKLFHFKDPHKIMVKFIHVFQAGQFILQQIIRALKYTIQ